MVPKYLFTSYVNSLWEILVQQCVERCWDGLTSGCELGICSGHVYCTFRNVVFWLYWNHKMTALEIKTKKFSSYACYIKVNFIQTPDCTKTTWIQNCRFAYLLANKLICYRVFLYICSLILLQSEGTFNITRYSWLHEGQTNHCALNCKKGTMELSTNSTTVVQVISGSQLPQTIPAHHVLEFKIFSRL